MGIPAVGNGTLLDPRACGQCRDCRRPMLPQPIYWQAPELRECGYVRHGGHSLCATDYLRARKAGTLPDPAPRRRKKPPRVDFHAIRTVYAIVCERCGEVTQATGRRAAEQAVEAHANSHLTPIEGGAT